MGGGVLSDGWIGQVGLVQSVTFGKILTQINIRIYLYQKNFTNEYPNIFVSKNLHERCSNKYPY